MPIVAYLADASPGLAVLTPTCQPPLPLLRSELAGLVCNMRVREGFTTKQLMDNTIQ